jgi:prepilin-type N-terminal cleavage/methylation domain-containing protein/prepilin-type processing-associated H-X9-DG protein
MSSWIVGWSVTRRERLHRRLRRGGGFTLIELLVVVAIIALLIAILLPSLQRAREAGRNVDCRSQLHQLSMGFYYYARDYKGALPVYWTGEPQRATWVDLIEKYLHSPQESFRCKSGPYGAFNKDRDGNWKAVDRFGRKANPRDGTSYSLNYWGFQLRWGNKGGSGGYPVTLDGKRILFEHHINRPTSEFSLVMDGKGTGICVPDLWLPEGETYWYGSGESGADYRHGGKRTNMGFLDGHADGLLYDQSNKHVYIKDDQGRDKYYLRYWDPRIPRVAASKN